MLGFLSVLLLSLAACSGTDQPLSGDYISAASDSASRTLELQLPADGTPLTFSAVGLPSGVAVDATGTVLSATSDRIEFGWTDSFGNSGDGLLERSGPAISMELNPTTIADSNPLRLYGQWDLERASLDPAKGKNE